MVPYDPDALTSTLNEALPEGLRFFDPAEKERTSDNLSNKTSYALYEAVFGLESGSAMPDPQSFLDQDSITIIKKDKKTRKDVEKDVKAFIRELSLAAGDDGSVVLRMMLRCASNETLNPGKLLQSLFKYYNLSISMDLFAEDSHGRLVPLRNTY